MIEVETRFMQVKYQKEGGKFLRCKSDYFRFNIMSLKILGVQTNKSEVSIHKFVLVSVKACFVISSI